MRAPAQITDRARFEALFHRHYGQVLRYAQRRCDSATAQDVVAETFTTAWRKRSEIPGDALPWLLGVARRVLSNEHRAGRRRIALSDKLLSSSDVAVSFVEPPDAPGGRVARALAGLSERDREALLLTAWDELTTAQAARAVGCTSVAMRVRLHRARGQLTQALNDAATAPTRSAPQSATFDEENAS